MVFSILNVKVIIVDLLFEFVIVIIGLLVKWVKSLMLLIILMFVVMVFVIVGVVRFRLGLMIIMLLLVKFVCFKLLKNVVNLLVCLFS